MTSTTTQSHSISDPMSAYEYLVDHVYDGKEFISNAVQSIIDNDTSGQFTASAARYLNAIDASGFASEIDLLLKSIIEKDREQHYMPSLLPNIWGEDYMAKAEELRDIDDNFRRIFKRVHPTGII